METVEQFRTQLGKDVNDLRTAHEEEMGELRAQVVEIAKEVERLQKQVTDLQASPEHRKWCTAPDEGDEDTTESWTKGKADQRAVCNVETELDDSASLQAHPKVKPEQRIGENTFIDQTTASSQHLSFSGGEDARVRLQGGAEARKVVEMTSGIHCGRERPSRSNPPLPSQARQKTKQAYKSGLFLASQSVLENCRSARPDVRVFLR